MTEIKIQKNVLSKNDELAAELRRDFARKGVLVLNMLSSPGSGKTTLLEKTARALAGKLRIAAIEGDLQTERDADRIRAAGVRAVQINTGRGCHLDANMIANILPKLEVAELDVLFIENVGNLVCPAAFDLGEDFAVLLMSVTEGDDKPAKYPTAFLKADLLVLNKLDLQPYTNFDIERFRGDVARVKPSLPMLQVSCTTEQGLESWFQWIERKTKAKRERPRR